MRRAAHIARPFDGRRLSPHRSHLRMDSRIQTNLRRGVKTISDASHSSPPSTFAVFRRRNFTPLWIAQFISTIGNGLLGVAASILVYRLTGSAMSVGFMLLAAAMPNLFVGLIAGVVVDRFDRKRIMIGANVICALAVAAIPVMLPRGIAWLYVLVAFSSAVEQ